MREKKQIIEEKMNIARAQKSPTKQHNTQFKRSINLTISAFI